MTIAIDIRPVFFVHFLNFLVSGTIITVCSADCDDWK